MPRITMPSDVLDRMEQLLQAQLQALQELRRMQEEHNDLAPVIGKRRKPKGVTHTDLAYQVLVLAGRPLHAYEITKHIHAHFGVVVKWESVVSTMSRRAARGEQFVRTAKNTYGIIGRDAS